MRNLSAIDENKALVTKEYVDTGLSGKQDTLTFDDVPTAGSSNPVKSSGIKSAIDNAVVANPTVAGTEADLTALQVGGTKYKVPSGGSGVSFLTVVDGKVCIVYDDGVSA